MSEYKGLEHIANELGCKTRINQDLKDYTTIKIGGPCPLLIEINSEDACTQLINVCTEENTPFIVLGKGSNVLIDDDGINSVVLYMGKDFSEITICDDLIHCQAGVSLSKLCMTALENNLSGLEFAYGIPGNVGGAVFMNAGAYNGEINDVIVSAKACDNYGNIYEYTNNEMKMSYRNSVFRENEQVILSADFRLKKDNFDEIKSRMNELMDKRKSKQPLEYPSAGSMFKRPQGSYAGMLIEQCGLKGCSVGGAEVSTKHCGFVINKNNAKFSDMLSLIDLVKKTVYEKTGYMLECEPIVISDKSIK